MFITTTLFNVCHVPWKNRQGNGEQKTGLKVLLGTGSTASIIPSSVAGYGELVRGTCTQKQWNTAAGTFYMHKKSTLVFILPEFSTSRKNVHQLHVEKSLTLGYDMILCLDLLNRLGVVIDFEKKTLLWDGADIYMPTRNNISEESLLMEIVDSQEPDSTAAACKRGIHILDVQYKKANLPELVQGCTHLTTEEKSELLALLENYAILFNGELGTFTGPPVDL